MLTLLSAKTPVSGLAAQLANLSRTPGVVMNEKPAVPAALLAQLRGSKTDLKRFVEAMLRDQLPRLVVPVNAVRAWQEREPQTWAMVCDWLAAQGKSFVLV